MPTAFFADPPCVPTQQQLAFLHTCAHIQQQLFADRTCVPSQRALTLPTQVHAQRQQPALQRTRVHTQQTLGQMGPVARQDLEYHHRRVLE